MPVLRRALLNAAEDIMPGTRRPAFTLLELLVVIGVIAILTGLAVVVTKRVSGTGKEVRTSDTLKVLSNALDEFMASAGSIPPPTVLDPRRTNPPVGGSPSIIQPVADVYTPDAPGGLINSVGLFMTQCEEQPTASGVFKNIDSRFVREYDSDGNGEAWDLFPPLRTAFDGWEQPIRYVHPAWDGLLVSTGGGRLYARDVVPAPTVQAPQVRRYFNNDNLQIERSNTTTVAAQPPWADGGICRGGQPYFYSAGGDGRVGYLVDNAGKVLEDYNEDNVYLTKPEYEKN